MSGVQTRSSTSRLSFLWQHSIPPELLAKVFEYLTVQDRLNVRLTCRRWSDVCLQPRFWERRAFSIKGRNGQEMKRYLSRFGGHLKHLSIQLVDITTWSTRRNPRWPFEVIRRKTTKVKSLRVSYLLKELLNTNYQLNSFRCDSWASLQHFKFDGIPFDHSVIQRALCSMLMRQHHLSDVQFFDTRLSEEEGCQLLNALPSCGPASDDSQLTHLTLREFFNDGPPVYSMPAFLEVIGRFKKLDTLQLTWDSLSDTFLERLNNTSPSLKRIFLYVDADIIKTPFSLPDWPKALEKNPVLKVYVIMYVYFVQFPYQDCLLPQLPLISLTLNIDMDFGDDWTTDAVESELTYATRCMTHLKIFILTFEMSVMCPWNRPEALVALVNACPSLSHLYLEMTLALDTLEQMAAAAHQARSKDEKAGGHSARPSLQIHVKDCDTSLERVMERVSAVNPFCKVDLDQHSGHMMFNQPLI